ncbi:hypothetical protein GCM10010129_83660 [Streptomyces fumigatiscleroticus]|nr:hypothetical protein GCM10010129_83660 [Streptomyces fumigatiscleroticus]
MTDATVPGSWTELAGQITAFLPELAPREAAVIVAGMTPSARGRVRAHLAEHPDALVSGSSLGPPAVQRLIIVLQESGIARARPPACHRCRRVRPLRRMVPGGRVCRGCEGVLAAQANVGVCGECGRTRPRPVGDSCTPCHQRTIAASRSCSVCGRASHLDLCAICRPRPPASCALCGTSAPVCARWPLRPVCKPCYALTRRHPARCPSCDAERVLIGRADGRQICAACAGHTDPYSCSRCGGPSSPLVQSLCDRCAVTGRLTALLDTLSSQAARQLGPLCEALLGYESPRTVLRWLRNSASARLLSDAATANRALTHTDLDQLAEISRSAAQTTDYLRRVLVTYGVLPARDEHLARIERHLTRVLARYPEHAALLRPYVRWSVLPRARRRARGRPSPRNTARWAYTRVNTAADFLSFTADLGFALRDVTQHQVDQWLAEGASTRYEVRDFVVWAARRGHSRDLLVPHRTKAEPVSLDEDSHWDLLQQCLHDDELPLDVRVAGALLLFFGQHLTRIAADSAAQFRGQAVSR